MRRFVDVGAFDGIHYSNVRALYEDGWTGICIEPASVNYEKLQELYAGTPVVTVRAAVAHEPGELDLHVAEVPGAPDWGSDTSSLIAETRERWPEYRWRKERVPVRTLNDILENHAGESVDFLSIDVEGAEPLVLDGLDLERWAPRLIIIEYNTQDRRREIEGRVREAGYRTWIDNGSDLFVTDLAGWRWYLLRGAGRVAEFIRRIVRRAARAYRYRDA